MKKIIVLIVSLVVLAGLGWYISTLFETKGKSDTSLIEFAIKDVSNIDKLIITDKNLNSFEIRKKGDTWTDAKGNCIIQQNVENILDAIRNIEFKGYLADKSHENYNKKMSAQNIELQIFENGEWVKTWYIGPPAPDHYGQIMLLDSKEYGKSTHPVLMKVKGLNGFLEPRFFADPRLWACTEIFSIPMEEIRRVDIKYNNEPARNFTVTKNGPEVKVYQQGKELENVEDKMAFSYLQNYKKIHYNLRNFELSDKQIDSLKRTTPFAEIKVKETNGHTTKLRCFPYSLVQNDTVAGQEIVNSDLDKFWCELPDGEIVKCQYFVFNPLLFGHIYFPMDQSGFTTLDGITPLESSPAKNEE
ncbi:MAG: hypothetical protein CSA03_00920 [Bacteroidetes bacterium]|nr:MAG: hypothetical protein CSA03_00920 [Bacteroidota bacterium]